MEDDDADQGAVGGAAADPAAGDAPPPSSLPHTQKRQQAKELMRTLSSAMEKPYWDTCQKAD